MALVPALALDAVLALGDRRPDGSIGWTASAFLYGYDIGDGTSKIFLVTNRHVIKDKEELWVRCNPSGDKQAVELPLDVESAFAESDDPDIDIAVAGVKYDKMRQAGMQIDYFSNSTHAAGLDKIRELGITEGDSVFVLGFPMGLVGQHRNTVIVRHGTIARIADAVAGRERSFLLDAFVFPGNSGGPVLLKPELTALPGTQTQPKALLIGIVRASVSYKDVAISAQTGMTRVVFTENSGLSSVHPINLVDDLIATHLKKSTPQQGTEGSVSQ